MRVSFEVVFRTRDRDLHERARPRLGDLGNRVNHVSVEAIERTLGRRDHAVVLHARLELLRRFGVVIRDVTEVLNGEPRARSRPPDVIEVVGTEAVRVPAWTIECVAGSCPAATRRDIDVEAAAGCGVDHRQPDEASKTLQVLRKTKPALVGHDHREIEVVHELRKMEVVLRHRNRRLSIGRHCCLRYRRVWVKTDSRPWRPQILRWSRRVSPPPPRSRGRTPLRSIDL